jgi:hypothetical protein
MAVFMKRAAQKRVFSLAMIVAVLSTSILAFTFVPTSAGDTQTTSSDQQLPFEENEKEFEDRDEADERNNGFGISLYLIDETGNPYYIPTAIASSSGKHFSRQGLPLFLTNRKLLI